MERKADSGVMKCMQVISSDIQVLCLEIAPTGEKLRKFDMYFFPLAKILACNLIPVRAFLCHFCPFVKNIFRVELTILLPPE